MHRSASRLTAFLAFLLLVPATSRAQSGENVALVINEASPVSQRIGAYYAQKRAVPETNIIRITAPTDDAVTRNVYGRDIETPIVRALRQHALVDRVLYIVLTKGVPLRIAGTEGLDGTLASVDSELTLLYRRMVGNDVQPRGRVSNPYFYTSTDIEGAQQFTHRTHDIFLVTRLDGFSESDVIGLIDRAQTPSSEGRIVLDQRGGTRNNPLGDLLMAEAARRVTGMGFGERVQLEGTPGGVRNVAGVLGYYSWGSNDPQNRARKLGITFTPGAIASTFVSSDARTFAPPPDGWSPSGNWNDRSSFYAGAPQSLAGDLIREGITGVAASVADPFLQSAVRPEILFPAYIRGFNLAEAFYLAMPHLSWQMVVIGDPLCRPFTRPSLTKADIEDPLDEATGYPGLFAKRRLERLAGVYRGVPENALALMLSAERREAQGDSAGAKAALEQATALSPTFGDAQLQLALLFERDGEHPRAQERYEAVLAVDPTNLIALNNLAFSVAVHKKAPADAKPFAERAYRLAPSLPTVSDTLAWIEHLLGNQPVALKLIALAVRGAPESADVRLHAAFIYDAAQQPTLAASELKVALTLNPELRTRDDVKELEARLSKSKTGGER